MRYPFIQHEYILLWERARAGTYQVLAAITKQNDRHVKGPGAPSSATPSPPSAAKPPSSDSTNRSRRPPPRERLASNENWQAKIRQTLQRHRDFHNPNRGVWGLA